MSLATLGRVSRWRDLPLRYLVTVLDGRRIPLNREERADRAGDIPYWGAGGIVDRVDAHLFNETLVLLGEDGAPFFDPDRPVAFRSEGPVWVNNHIHVLRPNLAVVSAGYLVYALNQVDYSLYITGSTRDKLTQEDLREIRIPVPPLWTQRLIEEFLDHETAQIDELIAKQEHLISTLAERRAAVTDDLTLGRRLPSRDWHHPAERWMGSVPVDWQVVPSHRLFSERIGRALPEDEQLTASQRYGIVLQREFAEREYAVMQVIKDPTILKHVEPGDFVISMRSFQGGLEYSQRRGCISSAYVMLVPAPQVEASYYRHLFKSTSYIQGLQSSSNLVRDGQALRFENFKKLALPVPPKDLQQRVAREIDSVQGGIDALTAKAQHAIDLLRERRQALISAAVTGQIDVGGAS